MFSTVFSHVFSTSNLMKSSTNDAAVRPVPRPQSQQLHQRLRGETSGLTDGHGEKIKKEDLNRNNQIW